MANQKLNATITIGGAVSGSLKSALGTTQNKLQEIGRTVTTLKNRQRELNQAIKQEEQIMRSGSMTARMSASARLQASQVEIGAINREIEALNRKQLALRHEDEAERRRNQRRANFAIQFVTRSAGAVALGATVGFPAFSLLKESAKFNYDMQMIGNTADMTKAQIVALGKSVMDASIATAQAAPTLQHALGFLVAAGMDVRTANDSIVTIGRTATASGADIEDLARAAFVLNDSLKIAPKDMQAALDTLAQAGKEGNVELKDMAKQLPVLGSGFVSLKMQGREAAATMGAALEIARKGAADPDEAANNMKNFIAKIMSPETLKKAKKHFGLDLYKVIKDAQTKGKNPFEAAMTSIIKATKGDQKAIGDLFQDMQVQNFLRPMIQNWEEYKAIKDKALNASGVTDRDFEKVRATAQLQMNELANSFGRVRILLGETIEPVFGKLSAALTPVLGKIETFIKDNRELVGNGLLVVGALAAIGTAGLAVGAVIAGLGVVVTTAATAWGALAAAAVGAGVLIWSKWEEIVGKLTAIINGMKQTIMDAMGSVGDAASYFTGKVGDITGFHPFSGNTPQHRLPPPAPSIATGRGAVSQTNTYNNDIKITQQPSENAEALADRMLKKLKQQNERDKRSIMFDPAMSGAY